PGEPRNDKPAFAGSVLTSSCPSWPSYALPRAVPLEELMALQNKPRRKCDALRVRRQIDKRRNDVKATKTSCRQVERRHATQLAPVLRVVERPAAVHGREVVPDDEITDAPAVAVDEARLGGMLGEVAQQQPAFGHRPADDVRGMRGEVQRTPPGAPIGAYEGMHGAFELLLLGGRPLEAERLARVGDGM